MAAVWQGWIDCTEETLTEDRWPQILKTAELCPTQIFDVLKLGLCYTSQLKYVFQLDENVSRAVDQNSLAP